MIFLVKFNRLGYINPINFHAVNTTVVDDNIIKPTILKNTVFKTSKLKLAVRHTGIHIAVVVHAHIKEDVITQIGVGETRIRHVSIINIRAWSACISLNNSDASLAE